MNHKTIAVIGLGHGGLVAACKLQAMGFSVTVFEQYAREYVGHPWYDDIRFDVFDACGLPLPPRDCYTNKGKRLFIAPDEQNSLRVPSGKPMEEISIDRRALLRHLTALCEDAGVTVQFETKVESLVVKENRVCGVTAAGKALPFDLVIDYKLFGSVTPYGERTLHFTLQNGDKVDYDESTPFVPLCAKGGLDNVIHTPTNTVLEKTGTKDWFVIWYQVLQSLKVFLQTMLRIG